MNPGTKWVLLMQKNRRRKSHAWAPLKEYFNVYRSSSLGYIKIQVFIVNRAAMGIFYSQIFEGPECKHFEKFMY
jgi:hypothetical protein